MYTSDQRLVVPARDKMLNLEVISNKNEYKPRETASYTILARDADGAPVPDAEVSLGVVDEAIYSVSPDFSGNIRQQFYGMRYNAVETHLSISYCFRGFAGEKPVDLASTKPSYQLADFKNEGEHGPADDPKGFQRHCLLGTERCHRKRRTRDCKVSLARQPDDVARYCARRYRDTKSRRYQAQSHCS